MATPIKNRIQAFFNGKKTAIAEKIIAEKSLPFPVQIAITIVFWILVFSISSFLVPLNSLLWVPSIVSTIVAFGLTELTNFMIQIILSRRELKELGDEAEQPSINVESHQCDIKVPSEPSLVVGFSKLPLALMLSVPEKKYVSLTPITVGIVKEAPPDEKSVFSPLSFLARQKLSLKYNCNIIDTPRYEALIVKGDTVKVKTKNYNRMLEEVSSVFTEIANSISEIETISGIRFEAANKATLLEIFPIVRNIIEIEQQKPTKGINGHTKNECPQAQGEKQLEYKLKTEENSSVSTIVESNNDEKQLNTNNNSSRLQQNKELMDKQTFVKELLYSELAYSLSSFFNAVRGYYVKALERELNTKYDEKPEKILKTAELFFEKKGLNFPFKSYNRFKRYRDFYEIEPPESKEIDEFINKLSYEYLTAQLDGKLKEELKEFLDQRLKPKKQLETYNGLKPKSTVIPTPPTYSEEKNLEVKENA